MYGPLCFSLALCSYFHLDFVVFVVSTSAIDCPKELIYQMTYYVASYHTITHPLPVLNTPYFPNYYYSTTTVHRDSIRFCRLLIMLKNRVKFYHAE